MAGIGDYLTNPISVKVHDENNDIKTVTLLFSKPYEYKGKKQIGLIILGNVSNLVIERIEQDLAAGIAIGHFEILCKIQQSKADAESLFIKSFSYQNYEFAYKEVVEYGAGIGIAMFQQKYLRKEIKQISKVKGIEWAEKSKNELVKAKEKDYQGTSVIAYWEKESNNNWIIPMEAVKIWHHVRCFSGEDVEQLAVKLYDAYKQGDQKEIKKLGPQIEKFIKEKEKN